MSCLQPGTVACRRKDMLPSVLNAPKRVFPGENCRRLQGPRRSPKILLDEAALLGRLGGEHVVDRVGEIVNARNGNDDDVAMALAILRDAEKSAAAILAQIDRKKLPFDLQLS
jgi:hypothetical protein